MANTGKHSAPAIINWGLARSARRATKVAPQVQETVIPLSILDNRIAEL